MSASAKILDVKGMLCPMPVIKAKQAISQVPVGGVLEVLATDPAAKEDIPAWVRRAGHDLISMQQEDETFKFLVKRKV
ncbi:MAG: sulfurtransferase TusA family protein [Thaumarchaeota archaeon]|nr:sulfurtransferase TusA family protein [Nitrososphaerota archaeon]